MSCDCEVGPIVVPATHVFARKTVSVERVPLTEPFGSANVLRVLTTLRIENLTTDLSVRIVVEGSNDGMTWDGADHRYGTWRTANTSPTVDENIGSLAATLFYRISLDIKNTATATRCESAVVSMVINPSSVA